MSDPTRHRPDGTVCCGNKSWCGRLCDYHQGYEDGCQPDFDGIAWVHDNPTEALIALEKAGVLVKRFAVPKSRYEDPNLDTWRLFDDPSHVYPEDDVDEVWVRVDTLPPLIGEEGADDGE